MGFTYAGDRRTTRCCRCRRGPVVFPVLFVSLTSVGWSQDDSAGPHMETAPMAGQSSALDAALAELDEAATPVQGPSPEEQAASAVYGADLYSRRVGAAQLRLLDVSLDTLFSAGASSERGEQLQTLQNGGHDPRRRGFTLQQTELSLMGAVDPFFTAEGHLIFFLDPAEGETEVELEEVFVTTQALPYDLQLEIGHFFTEFGRQNAQHPHQWDWQDQPVINNRFFGPDGMRAPGLRLAWLTPLSWHSEVHLGMQNANGETMGSFLANDEFFEDRAVAGRPFADRDVKSLEDFVYLMRWTNSVDLSDELSGTFGVSGLWGANATGPDGQTFVYGADLVMKWRPLVGDRGWPFMVWQTEVMGRTYHADDGVDEGDDPVDVADDIALRARNFDDWGLYTQLLYGFRRGWAAGVRYEFATGSGESVGGRSNDPFRDDRHRAAPLVVWHPTEFSRVRLQYNFDYVDHLDSSDVHSVWAGIEFFFGEHPAHTY